MAKFIFFTAGRQFAREGDHSRLVRPATQESGVAVSVQKLDPYINVDAGTMNPYQHGEVFVTRTAPRRIWTSVTTSASSTSR